MILHLDKDQARLVHQSLELLHMNLRTQVADQVPAVKELVLPSLFQLELLITWFDKQRELES